MDKNKKRSSAQRSQRTWSFMGLFIMALVISMPFYSAQTLAAAITITTNTGQAGIPNFIDARSDIWKVEATITDPIGETVDPANVRLASGSHETKFTSCSTGGMGTVCQYLSPLPEGVREQTFMFNVKYYFVGDLGINDSIQDGGYIYADGSAPKIRSPSAVLANPPSEGVLITFTAEEVVSPGVGLKSVTVTDLSTGQILRVKDDFEPGTQSHDFSEAFKLSGEGRKLIKISAEDLLGHKSRDEIVETDVDFVKPSIQMQTLNFTRMGDFIGQYSTTTDVSVDVLEASTEGLKATAFSEQGNFPTNSIECDPVDLDNKLWRCTWKNVEFIPVTSITVKINATDGNENSDVQERTKTPIKDETGPVLEYFGTENQFEGRNYVSPNVNNNRIILKARDQPGVGMASTGVTANLDNFAGKDSYQPPTQCNETEGLFTCYWDAGKPKAQSGTIRFGLSTFEDKVGNDGTAPDVEAIVDNSGPNIEEMTIIAVSEDGREKDFYQSNDKLRIKFTAAETSGLIILVDEKDLSNNPLPENELTRGLGADWEAFTEQNCLRNESKWDCVVETQSIKSGPSPSTKWALKIRDTAGNEAAVWPEAADVKNVKSYTKENSGSNAGAHFTIDILGLSTEESPDYWEAKPATALGFVDMDITSLMATRQVFNVTLNSDNGQVKLRSVELNGGCELNNTGVPLGRIVTWSNNYIEGKKGQATFVLMMEFQPFDSRQAFASMLGAGIFDKAAVTGTCQFLLYSQVGEEALRYPEIQDVPISVDFAFTELGGKDENLAQIIKDETEAVNSGWWGALATLDKIFKIVTYIAKLAQILVTVVETFQLGKVAFAGASLVPIESELPAIADAGVLGAITFCMGSDLAAAGVSTSLDIIQVPLQILTCKKISYTGDEKPDSFAGWYNSVVYVLINYYNEYATFYETKVMNLGVEDKDKIKAIPPAVSVYDNIYLSIVSLCIPGIIHNLEKLRQIKCRHITCLKDEIPQGLATVEACAKLESVMRCKYVFGPLFQLIPFVSLWDGLMRGFSSLVTDPIAIVSTSIIVGCSADCLHSNRVEGPAGLIISSACVKMYFVIKLVGIVESVWSGIQDVKAGIVGGGSNYCGQIEPEEEEEDEEEEGGTPAATEEAAAGGPAEASATV